MIKFRLFYDTDKETKWLNELSEKGYAMTGFFAGFYKFEACNPGEYIYQIDFGEKFFSVSENYREFMEETGVEIVQCWGPWVVLRQKASEGEFELYTDVDSRIEHYTKILRMFKIATILELIVFMMEGFSAISGNPFAPAFMFIIGAFIVTMLNAVIKNKQIIAQLKERKGELSENCRFKNGNISMFLPSGLLLSSGIFLLQDSMNSSVKHFFQIIAILLMLIGLYRSARTK